MIGRSCVELILVVVRIVFLAWRDYKLISQSRLPGICTNRETRLDA